ncbi:monovalent cation/H(+) antiporter subunit G [Martelella mediterranea]|uniref:monovalent cation/H(+) antiporter subunit G n=1 Tax=Martelella mediterranea TaxID=293089 RepID=UPI001E36C267|nr:monovalent cation/H(+) antiporter subunit G [Martelella mediterranea]MCD1632980.1 monovalent cation/H(+) antiporter subunit G [Martelella mediterranea]
MAQYLLAGLVSLLMLAGAAFTLTAAIGIIRLPDLYSRMHAASKAGTVGAGLIFLAIGIHAGEISTFVRACAGIVFFIITAPISAHLLARASHEVGYPLYENTVRDKLQSRDSD